MSCYFFVKIILKRRLYFSGKHFFDTDFLTNFGLHKKYIIENEFTTRTLGCPIRKRY